MANKYEVELFISEDGQVKAHIKGINGPACLKVLSGLSSKIGVEGERRLTAEYYSPEISSNVKAQVKNK